MDLKVITEWRMIHLAFLLYEISEFTKRKGLFTVSVCISNRSVANKWVLFTFSDTKHKGKNRKRWRNRSLWMGPNALFVHVLKKKNWQTHLFVQLISTIGFYFLQESLLNGRIEPSGVVEGFTVEIGASGNFCPKHCSLPVTAFFFNLSEDNAPSPYLVNERNPSVNHTKELKLRTYSGWRF